MVCIHGLDEINCPTCRIIRFSAPINAIKIKNFHQHPLKLNDFMSINNLGNEKDFDKEIMNFKRIFKAPKEKMFFKKPSFVELPNFQNNLFLERLKEIDIKKIDHFEISKKIPLETSEWKFEKED
ncbi:MAG: hypothetical protein ACTSQJ_09250 [Promethearchaeota archaeon]